MSRTNIDENHNYASIQQRARFNMTRVLSALSLAVTLVFGIVQLNEANYPLAFVLLLISFLGCINIFFNSDPEQYYRSVIVLAICAYILALTLTFAGGQGNTGLYWVYPLICIMIIATPIRVGLFLLFLYVASTGLSWLFQAPWIAVAYDTDTQIRFLVSLFMVGLICISREYTSVDALKKMDELREKFNRAANTDSLTQLYNRRFVSENYIREDRFQGSFDIQGAILLADVDYFKKINDNHGHDVGDEVLKQVANRLLKSTRSGDVLSRWGGEEFLIIIPGIPADAAQNRAQQFVDNIARDVFQTRTGELSVTISIGIGFIEQGKEASKVLAEADEKLYEAKRNGRNLVCG